MADEAAKGMEPAVPSLEATALAAIRAVGSTHLEEPADIVEYVRGGDGDAAAQLVAKAFGLEPATEPALAVEGTLRDAWVPVAKLTGCARCGEEHHELVFRPLVRAVERDGDVIATHWAACPTSGDPILMITLPKPGKEATTDGE